MPNYTRLRKFVMNNELSNKYVVTIDANVFHRQSYNFNSPHITELLKVKDKNIKTILSDIVYHEIIKNFEIEKNIDKKIKQFNNLIDFTSQYNILSKDLQNTIEHELNNCDCIDISKKQVDDFCNKYDIEIINTSEYFDMKNILDMYIKSIAPFEKNKKKSSEFQDAMTLIGLEKWADKNNYKILAISEDNGWKNYAQNSKYIKVFDNISDVLEHLLYLEGKQKEELDALKEKSLQFINNNDKFSETIKEYINSIELFVHADSHYYYEVDDNYIEYIDHTFEEEQVAITEINQGYCDMMIPINIDCQAHAHFSFEVKDSIDGDYIVIGGCNENIEINDDIVFFLRLNFNEYKEIEEFELLNNHNDIFEVDFGFVEPSWDEDYEL